MTNTDQTRLDLVTLKGTIDAAQILSLPEPDINFDGDIGWADMTSNDVYNLIYALGQHQQKRYTASRMVEEKHALTPYTDTTLAAMRDDFDTFLAGL